MLAASLTCVRLAAEKQIRLILSKVFKFSLVMELLFFKGLMRMVLGRFCGTYVFPCRVLLNAPWFTNTCILRVLVMLLQHRK
jgi:hypothetical protein